MDISLSNVVVREGGYFELRLEQYLPNRTEDGFGGVVCGLKERQGGVIPLTIWVFFGSSPGMKFVNSLPEDYSGRLTVYNTTLKVTNAEFADEEKDFYCELIYKNQTTGKDESLLKVVKLETVYGKQIIQLLERNNVFIVLYFSSLSNSK